MSQKAHYVFGKYYKKDFSGNNLILTKSQGVESFFPYNFFYSKSYLYGVKLPVYTGDFTWDFTVFVDNFNATQHLCRQWVGGPRYRFEVNVSNKLTISFQTETGAPSATVNDALLPGLHHYKFIFDKSSGVYFYRDGVNLLTDTRSVWADLETDNLFSQDNDHFFSGLENCNKVIEFTYYDFINFTSKNTKNRSLIVPFSDNL